MGWVLALLFLLLAAVLLFLLDGANRDNKRLTQRISQLEALARDKAALQAERDKYKAAYSAVRMRMKGVLDADEEQLRVQQETASARESIRQELDAMRASLQHEQDTRNREIRNLDGRLAAIRTEHRILTNEVSLIQSGFYDPAEAFATSLRYRKRLAENTARQKKMTQDGTAVLSVTDAPMEGRGNNEKTLASKFMLLMLRAFNNECDAAAARAKAGNYEQMAKRILRAFKAINVLGEPQGCRLSDAYLDLRLEGLKLAHEHARKLQLERDEQRAIKEELRQQRKAEREIERARRVAEREEETCMDALEQARADLRSASAPRQQELAARVAELEQMLADARAQKERAISRAQQTRSGHVYVISNIGSFGPNVFKIGMTRRLDPFERIGELSGASVPFRFDVHAIIYSDDAPSLEHAMHKRFADRRVNAVNERKEFFHVTIEEIADVVWQNHDAIEFTMAADASDYLQSEAIRRSRGQLLLGSRFAALPAPSK